MLMLNTAQWSGNSKKGARLKLSDFEPRYRTKNASKIDPKFAEDRLKAQLNSIAKHQKI
jgi:hypothetical protein